MCALKAGNIVPLKHNCSVFIFLRLPYVIGWIEVKYTLL